MTGAQGTPGAQGPPGFALLDYNSATFTNTPNSQVGGVVPCDAGLRVVGGGVSTQGGYNEQHVNASYPSSNSGTPGTTAWTAYVDSYLSVTRTFTVWVICAQATQVTSITGTATGIASKKP